MRCYAMLCQGWPGNFQAGRHVSNSRFTAQLQLQAVDRFCIEETKRTKLVRLAVRRAGPTESHLCECSHDTIELARGVVTYQTSIVHIVTHYTVARVGTGMFHSPNIFHTGHTR